MTGWEGWGLLLCTNHPDTQWLSTIIYYSLRVGGLPGFGASGLDLSWGILLHVSLLFFLELIGQHVLHEVMTRETEKSSAVAQDVWASAVSHCSLSIGQSKLYGPWQVVLSDRREGTQPSGKSRKTGYQKMQKVGLSESLSQREVPTQ